MGKVSPTLIQLANKDLKSAGKTAGSVYSISTVGGILMTLLMGFYLLPEWGIRNSLYSTVGLLSLALLFSLISGKLASNSKNDRRNG